jgi:uncharacterized iron-regulated membrane protein
MAILGGLGTIGGFVFFCGLVFVLFLCGLVVWYWKNQPEKKATPTAPEPPIQATIEHPTAATPAAPAAPVAPTAPSAPDDAMPPNADA